MGPRHRPRLPGGHPGAGSVANPAGNRLTAAPRGQSVRPGLLALLAILLVTGLVWQRQRVQRLTVFDQPFYLGIAHDLVHDGRFTDGYVFAQPAADGHRPAGMRFAPLYPALLAAATRVDATLHRGMDCVVAGEGHDDGCPTGAPSLRGLQFMELAGVFWLVWWMGRAAGGPITGWLSLGLALLTTKLLLGSVNYLMTEMTCLTFSTAAIAAGVQAAQSTARAGIGWAAAAGVLLGLTALTRPAFVYLVPGVLVVAPVLVRRRGARPLLGFAAGVALTLAPWIARNAVVLNRAALTHGYDSHTLVQRIAFDTMTWREYGRAYLCWLPDGTSLGRTLIGPHGCDRFAWDDQPTSFYVLGLRHMLPQTLAAAGGYDHHLQYLLTHYILAMPVWHALVSIPLALRGAYVAHWWGFLLLVPALAWTLAALFRIRAAAPRTAGAWNPAVVLLLALPAWFMLAFNAAVAVNQVRYNLLLIPAYAVCGALGLRRLLARLATMPIMIPPRRPGD